METETISGNNPAAETEEQVIFESVSSNGTEYTVSSGNSEALTNTTPSDTPTETTSHTEIITAIDNNTQELATVNKQLTAIIFVLLATWLIAETTNIVRRFFYNAGSN